MHLLLEIGVLILEFVVLDHEFIQFVLGLVVEGLELVLGLCFLLQSLDEADDSLALLWRKVAE